MATIVVGLAESSWTCDARTIYTATDITESQGGVNDATETFAGDQTSSDSVAINLEVLGVPLEPEVRYDSARAHGRRVVGSWNDEGDTNSHPVWQPVAVLLALTSEVRLLNADLSNGQNTEGDAEYPRGQWNRNLRQGDRLGDGPPSSNRGDGKLALLSFGIKDARISKGK